MDDQADTAIIVAGSKSQFDGLNQGVLSAFSEKFIYQSAAGEVLLHGVFSDSSGNKTVGAVGFSDRSYTLNLLESVALNNRIEAMQCVVVRGVRYSIIGSPEIDLTGMATLYLRPYA